MLGEVEHKEPIRESLVMKLAELQVYINEEIGIEKVDKLQNIMNELLDRLNLTEREIRMFNFELRNEGI
jgi:CRISPR/Cas system CSM-associated protein Csm2 small subunit